MKNYLDGDPLLAVDGLSWHQVPCDQRVLLAAGNEDSVVPVGLHNHLGSTPHATARSSSTAATSATTATALVNTSTTWKNQKRKERTERSQWTWRRKKKREIKGKK